MKGSLCRSLAASGFLADRCPGRAAFAQSGNPANVHGYTRPAESYALRPGRFQACPDTLRDADALLLGDRGDDGDYRVLDYNFRIFARITKLGTFGNNRKKSLLQTLNGTPVCAWNRMSVEVQRGFDSCVSQLLLRDLSGHANIVKDGSVDVTQLKPCRLCRRPQNTF